MLTLLFVRLPSAQAGELLLQVNLMDELNRTLQAYVGLHDAMWREQDEQTEIRIRDVIRQVERTRTFLSFAKPYERGHLKLILDAAHGRLERAQSAFGEERKGHLEEAVNDLVNVVRIYRVDRAYAIYFCARDKLSWVQKASKAQNPFESGPLKDCGFRIRE